MKTGTSVLFGALTLVLFTACHSTRTLQKERAEKRKPSPNAYWSHKRAHPVYGFDSKAYFKGMQEAASIQRDQTKIGVDLNGTWLQEGPYNIGGRIDVITPLHRTSDTIFVGTPNGGIFRTYDDGLTWTPVFDAFSYLAIGAITIDPSNSHTVYAGTGDRNFGGGSYDGNGLYKSTDLGENWTHVGLTQVGIISSVIVHPDHPDWLLVGAMGSGFAKNNDRGVFRSTDGGVSWQQTLFVSDSSGVCEMVADPVHPDVIYACTFNRVNIYGNSIADGPDGKIFKSTDAGVTWTQLTNGLPSTNTSRVGIAVAESNPDKLYAVYISDAYNLLDIFVSSDAGDSWSSLNAASVVNGLPANLTGGFGWYFGRIHVNPYNENYLVLPGVDQFASTDGGQTWTQNVPGWAEYVVHADKHALYFRDSLTMTIGTDGGMYRTYDGGENWSKLGQLPITQFYRITAKTFDDGVYAGGAQDNGTTSGNQMSNWNRDFGGDGFQPYYVEPSMQHVLYETQRGGIYWYSLNEGFESMSLSDAFPSTPVNWNAPYLPLNDGSIVAGTNRLVVRNDPPYDTWETVSGDLTRTAMGATTPASYHTITEIAANPFNNSEILAGTSDGLVWKGTVQSGNWTNISTGLPERYVSAVVWSKKTNGKLYLTMTGYYNNFSQELVYKSENGGQSWTDISGDLPQVGVNALITYIVAGNEVLFAGTDAGVYYSENDGQNWHPVGTNFPVSTVSALDMDAVNHKLIAGTYGRSMWSYDLNWYIGLEEAALASENIYPNPVNDVCVLKGQTSFVKVINTSGKVVWEHEGAATDLQLDLRALSAGVYLVKTDAHWYRIVKQ